MEQLQLPDVPNVRRLKIVRDLTPLNPREWDNLGTMVCWHGRYTLGDEQPSMESKDYLLMLADKYAPGISERLENWDAAYPYPYTEQDRRKYRSDLSVYWGKCVQPVLNKNYVMLELFLYDHSGITMRTAASSCPWDCGKVGFIYVDREKILEEYGWKVLTAKRREQLRTYLDNEVQTYDQYLTGDVWGFVVEELDNATGEWEETDSCWGFYGDDAEGVHAHVTDFTLEQVRKAFADPWFIGRPGAWVQNIESTSQEQQA